MSTIGIVGDLHLPFTHEKYLQFCVDIFNAWEVDRVIFIGDVVDQHALGFWEHDPDGFSAGDEAAAAVDMLKAWKREFSQGDELVCIGNHDDRHYRVARKIGLPRRYLKGYADVFNTPDWSWVFKHKQDGVLYIHGTGASGKYAAINQAIERRTSVVMGHTHYNAGALYHTNEDDRIFGLQVGCGIDCSAYAFHYGKDYTKRPVLGCGVVIDGKTAIFEPMLISRGETYSKK